MNHIEAMKQALEALESCTPEDTSTGHVIYPSYDEQAVEKAITALRTAIEQAEKQEPVAWVVEDQNGERLEWAGDVPGCAGLPTFPLYTTPPAAPVQEPVETGDTMFRQFMSEADKAGITHWPTPTAAQRQWVGLTPEEWFKWWQVSTVLDNTEAEIDFADFLMIALAVQDVLGEKNGGAA